MSCGCKSYNQYPIYNASCGCSPVPINCTEICTSFYIQNSWTVPSCGTSQSAVLIAPSLKNLLVGGYIWNPQYGYYKVVAFNAISGEVTIQNDTCLTINVPGTPIPPNAVFYTSDTPAGVVIPYTPTFPVSGTMTFTPSIVVAKYSRNGDIIDFWIKATGVLTGTGTTTIYVTPPVTPATDSINNIPFTVQAYESASLIANVISVISSVNSNIAVIKPSNFASAGSTAIILISGSYIKG